MAKTLFNQNETGGTDQSNINNKGGFLKLKNGVALPHQILTIGLSTNPSIRLIRPILAKRQDDIVMRYDDQNVGVTCLARWPGGCHDTAVVAVTMAQKPRLADHAFLLLACSIAIVIIIIGYRYYNTCVLIVITKGCDCCYH